MLMDPLFMNDEQNSHEAVGSDGGVYKQKSGFIRSKVPYEHLRMYKSPSKNSLLKQNLNINTEEEMSLNLADELADYPCTNNKDSQGHG
jgi:hypothetical protein